MMIVTQITLLMAVALSLFYFEVRLLQKLEG